MDFPGGEKHAMTGMSYTSCANHAANMNVEGTEVVSLEQFVENTCPVVRGSCRLVYNDSKGSRLTFEDQSMQSNPF